MSQLLHALPTLATIVAVALVLVSLSGAIALERQRINSSAAAAAFDKVLRRGERARALKIARVMDGPQLLLVRYMLSLRLPRMRFYRDPAHYRDGARSESFERRARIDVDAWLAPRMARVVRRGVLGAALGGLAAAAAVLALWLGVDGVLRYAAIGAAFAGGVCAIWVVYCWRAITHGVTLMRETCMPFVVPEEEMDDDARAAAREAAEALRGA